MNKKIEQIDIDRLPWFSFELNWITTFEALSVCSDSAKSDIFDGIMAGLKYGLTGEYKDFESPPAKVAFALIRSGIDESRAKMETSRAMRSERAKIAYENKQKKKLDDIRSNPDIQAEADQVRRMQEQARASR